MKKYVQITAGRGPVECARAVTLVAGEMLKAIPSLALTDYEPHHQAHDCYMSMTLNSIDDIPASVIQQWQGTILWRSTCNPYRPTHKRNNWFVGVSFFDEITLPSISDSDITFEYCRSGGKGGQNVNKVETAVRATHIPSGISVRCSDERSQVQNKSRARERLLLKIHDRQNEIKKDARADRWAQHDALQRGNPVKKFSGPL